MENTYKNKIFFAFLINLLIISFEFIGLILSLERHGVKVFEYYTENSNYFSLLVSVIFCAETVKRLKSRDDHTPIWIHVLRFTSTVCLSVTLVVVLFVLIPMYPHTFKYMLFQNSNLYQHLLCPVLSIISFIFLENNRLLSKKAIIMAIIPTIVYGGVCIVLNIFHLLLGPYPFFYIYEIPWYISLISLIGILLGAITIAWLLFIINNKNCCRQRCYEKNINI